MADNHEWADRVADGRQQQLERVGRIVLIALVAAVVALVLL